MSATEKRHRAWRVVRPALVAGLAVVVGAGFWISVVPGGRERLAHTYQRFTFQWLADRATEGLVDPQAKVVRLLEYVHANLADPPSRKPIGDVELIEILAAGRGWCDQQAGVLIQLVRTIPLDARLVFLQDGHGQSPHSVAEVRLHDTWRVLDPYVGLAPRNADGALATREELAGQPELLTAQAQARTLNGRGPAPDVAAMAQWFRQPPRVFNSWRGNRKAWFARLPTPLQQAVVYGLQELYLWSDTGVPDRTPSRQQLHRAQHHLLVGHSRAAEHLLKKLLAVEDPEMREDAMFFLARAYQVQGRFDEAAALYLALRQEERKGGWEAVAGAAFEGLGRSGYRVAQAEATTVGHQPDNGTGVP